MRFKKAGRDISMHTSCLREVKDHLKRLGIPSGPESWHLWLSGQDLGLFWRVLEWGTIICTFRVRHGGGGHLTIDGLPFDYCLVRVNDPGEVVTGLQDVP